MARIIVTTDSSEQHNARAPFMLNERVCTEHLSDERLLLVAFPWAKMVTREGTAWSMGTRRGTQRVLPTPRVREPDPE
jgi:hypothetical protein